MRSRSRLSSLATHLLAGVVGILLGWVALPIWRSVIMAANQQQYGDLVEQCDTSMREHFQAKRDRNLGRDRSEKEIEMSEVGLVVCQDYDLFQKRLLNWGLRENELAQMRLRAIEARATDLDEIVNIHEIRY